MYIKETHICLYDIIIEMLMNSLQDNYTYIINLIFVIMNIRPIAGSCYATDSMVPTAMTSKSATLVNAPHIKA